MLQSGFIRILLTTGAFLLAQTHAAFDLGFKDDSDLTNFVTRPEIKAPLFNVTKYHPNQITPGLWMVAPYAFIQQDRQAKNYYQPCQTGPAIYDGNGDLVWSGACEVENQNACDFRLWNFNDTQYLSTILSSYAGGNDRKGHGIIMNSSLDVVQQVHTSLTINQFNMHELNLIENGTKAIYLLFDPMRMDLLDLQKGDPDLGFDVGWVADMGFREVDVATGDIIFEWWAARSRHVSLTESAMPIKDLAGPYPQAWNWFHGNSVEKNDAGDYMISSRYTNTIFKVSGEDGSVMWRLGGNLSSFTQDFNFSRQHDARWISSTPEREVVSFLDNASDENTNTSSSSSALIVELDHQTKRASILKRIVRPDKGLSRLRGNHQVLPNDHSFVCWSENSFISEHNVDGDILMEAKFFSRRFVTYRAYKFNFTSTPSTLPTVKAIAYGASEKKATTVIYVSWNGATEVSSWRFRDSVSGKVLGERERTGFETSFHAEGYHGRVHAEALSSSGERLGSSLKMVTDMPPHWYAGRPQPGWTDPHVSKVSGDHYDVQPVISTEDEEFHDHEDDSRSIFSSVLRATDNNTMFYCFAAMGTLAFMLIGLWHVSYCRRLYHRLGKLFLGDPDRHPIRL